MPLNSSIKRGAEEISTESVNTLIPKRRRVGVVRRLKDGQETGTHWDLESHMNLRTSCKHRGIYRKDMSKKEMIDVLVAEDRESKRKRDEREKQLKKAKLEAEEKQLKMEKELREREERKLKKKEFRRRAEERADRLAMGEEVSEEEEIPIEDLESSPEPLNLYGFGQMMSNDESEDSRSSTEPPTASTASPTFPHQKLRIYEWPFYDLPSQRSPRDPYSPSGPGGRRNSLVPDEVLPIKLPYAVMNLVTTVTKEPIELPGSSYPEGVRPDFVPKLSRETIEAAHNGTLVGTLRRAKIEKAKDWAERTQVQWWNGLMFFNIPSQENREKFSLKDKKIKKSKAQLMLDTAATAESHPPVCYLPAFLDFPYIPNESDSIMRKKLRDLYYVRFPGMDLPHYFFWAHSDWKNPLKPNPHYAQRKKQDEAEAREAEVRQRQLFSEDRQLRFIPSSSIESSWRPYSMIKGKKRVKKVGIASRYREDETCSLVSTYEDAVSVIERELIVHGFAVTLYKYERIWKQQGKQDQWEYFIDRLVHLYPSGKLPEAPPVHERNSNNPLPRSLAEKMAAIQIPGRDTPVMRLQGDEPWTRDDDSYWDIVDAGTASAERTLKDTTKSIENLDMEDSVKALTRSKEELPGFPGTFENFDEWLKGIPDSSHSTAPSSLRPRAGRELDRTRYGQWLVRGTAQLPVSTTINDLERQHWERDFHALVKKAKLRADGPWSTKPVKKPIEKKGSYPSPFWALKSNTRSYTSKPNFHTDPQPPLSRRASSHTKSSKGLYNLRSKSPGTTKFVKIATPPKGRRGSKVTFSPTIVEKRTAYNDLYTNNTSTDGDASSAALSPRKSSFKHQQIDPTFQAPTTPSDHIPSPFLPNARRYRRDHSNATWKRSSIGSDDSLEFHTGHRSKKPTRDKHGRFTKRGSREVKPSTTDLSYISPPRTPSRASKFIEPLVPEGPRKRKRVQKEQRNSKYHFKESLSSPSSAESPILRKTKKRRKISDQNFRDMPSPSSPDIFSPPIVKRRKKNKRNEAEIGAHHKSDQDIASFKEVLWDGYTPPDNQSIATDPTEDAFSMSYSRTFINGYDSTAESIPGIATASPSSISLTSTGSMPPKNSTLPFGCILMRRPSSFPIPSPTSRKEKERRASSLTDEETQRLIEQQIMADTLRLDSDYIALPHSSRAPTSDTREVHTSSNSKGKKKQQKTTTSSPPPVTKSIRKTLSERKLVEPRLCAPAKRLSVSTPPLTIPSSILSSQISTPPSFYATPVPLKVQDAERLSRPSLSEPSPIVPPNTPAVHILLAKSTSRSSKFKSKKGRTVQYKPEVEIGSGSELDANVLSEKMGRVKTTRGGLVRELPVSVKETQKGKARGKAVAKAKRAGVSKKDYDDKKPSSSDVKKAPTNANGKKVANARTQNKTSTSKRSSARRDTRNIAHTVGVKKAGTGSIAKDNPMAVQETFSKAKLKKHEQKASGELVKKTAKKNPVVPSPKNSTGRTQKQPKTMSKSTAGSVKSHKAKSKQKAPLKLRHAKAIAGHVNNKVKNGSGKTTKGTTRKVDKKTTSKPTSERMGTSKARKSDAKPSTPISLTGKVATGRVHKPREPRFAKVITLGDTKVLRNGKKVKG